MTFEGLRRKKFINKEKTGVATEILPELRGEKLFFFQLMVKSCPPGWETCKSPNTIKYWPPGGWLPCC
jgi:hypothetical protein